jgi:lipopolysaccharide transport system ATP-binding protein
VGALLELGSGFHPEYTGRENIHLSSALMGLSRRETASKLARSSSSPTSASTSTSR